MPKVLKGKSLNSHLSKVPGWELYDKSTKLKREFEFKDFDEAIRFINKVAQVAEEINHHPNIYLYDYKKVRAELSTHKIGGLGEIDFNLASRISELFGK